MNANTVEWKNIKPMALLMHATEHPAQADWDDFLERMREEIKAKKTKALLVYSRGGTPTSNQREALIVLLSFHHLAAEVIVDLADPLQLDAGGCTIRASNWLPSFERATYDMTAVEHAVGALGCGEVENITAMIEQFNQALV